MRLRRGGIVVIIALGLVSMHGLAAASPVAVRANARAHGHDASAAVAGHPAATTDAAHTSSTTGDEHDPLHALGQSCIWLLAGGALLFTRRRLAQGLTAHLAAISQGLRLRRPSWATFDHPPDRRLATVIQRC